MASHIVRPPLRASNINVVRRRITSGLVAVLAVLATIVVVTPLIAILLYLLKQGVSSLNWDFFTKVPVPVGEKGGGMETAIVEFGGNSRMGNLVRFTADVLNGVPSIVMGIAIYALIVLPQKHFSAFAGGVVLGVMMVPTVTRTTEEMLRMVPHAIREAALGLGVPNWRSVLTITLRTASAGIVTGCMLAFARVAGETAPLLFTAFGNAFRSTSLNEPIAALPLQIFVYAVSPYDEWHRLAWAGALVLIVLIMVSVALVRYVVSRGTLKGAS